MPVTKLRKSNDATTSAAIHRDQRWSGLQLRPELTGRAALGVCWISGVWGGAAEGGVGVGPGPAGKGGWGVVGVVWRPDAGGVRGEAMGHEGQGFWKPTPPLGGIARV